MSHLPLVSALALALSLTAARSQPPAPISDGGLFRNIDPANGDGLNFKPAEEKPGVPKEKLQNATEITANNAEFNNKTHIAIFTGEVIVVNPDFNVNCDKLTAYLKHDDKPAAAPNATPKPATPAPEPGAPAKAKGGGLEKAIAEMNPGGKVIITQDKKEADGSITHAIGKGEKAVYDAVSGNITLTGSPEIRQGISRVVPAEDGVTLILNRDGRYKAIGRTKTLLQDNEKSDKSAH